MWQRGLSLYYAERHSEAMHQFRKDVAVNPNDTEESIWHWLARVRLLNGQGEQDAIALARTGMLQVGTDPRPVMRRAMELFTGQGHSGGDRGAVAALDAAGGPRTPNGQKQHDRFCAASFLASAAGCVASQQLARLSCRRLCGATCVCRC